MTWQRLRQRHSLARDITVIVMLKLTALIAIKLIWFSDSPAVSPSEIREQLFESRDANPRTPWR